MTEDIITELSRFSELLVIARNSSYRYMGKAVDIRQVGRELGARYVLEGSVRWSGDRIRIAAQLIDAATGAHRWPGAPVLDPTCEGLGVKFAESTRPSLPSLRPPPAWKLSSHKPPSSPMWRHGRR